MRLHRQQVVTVTLEDLSEVDVEAITVGLQMLVNDYEKDGEEGDEEPTQEDTRIYRAAKTLLGGLRTKEVPDLYSTPPPLPADEGFAGDTLPPPPGEGRFGSGPATFRRIEGGPL